MITLFHVGPKGFNVGNHAISMGLRSMVRGAFGRVVNWISIPATSRYEAQSRAGLTARTIHEINQFGDGVIVGGGNLYENGELDLDVEALEALEVPLMVFSVSWGRIYNRRGELVRRTDAMPDQRIQALNKRANISLARDTATLEHLHSVGATNAELGGCPTITLGDAMDTLPDIPDEDKGGTFISIRTPELMNIPLPAQRRTSEDIRALVAWCREHGREPRLLCHDHRDIPYAASLADAGYVYTENVSQYLSLLRWSDLTITYRLHAALPLLAMGRPFVKLSYDERSLSLMDTVGLGQWNIDTMATANAVGEVEDRYSRLRELPTIVSDTAPIREALVDKMRSSMEAFSGLVHDYHDSTTGHHRT